MTIASNKSAAIKVVFLWNLPALLLFASAFQVISSVIA